MRVVLYADDMEPITVIDLPEFAWWHITKRKMVRLAVFEEMQTSPIAAERDIPLKDVCKTVTIFAERIVRNGREHSMLFTKDDESALLLKCAFLPGQQAGLQKRERAAFARGFLDALVKLGSA